MRFLGSPVGKQEAPVLAAQLTWGLIKRLGFVVVYLCRNDFLLRCSFLA